MEKIYLKIQDKEDLPILLQKKSSKRIAVFVSGSGDIKDSFAPIMDLLSDDKTTSLLSFSFRGRESEKSFPAEQQIEDLHDIIGYLIHEGYTEISLIPTSMGFVSTAIALSDKRYTHVLGDVLMLDPADYPTDHSKGSWSGKDQFTKNKPLYSDYLESIEGDYKVNVVFFSLRNFTENYKDYTYAERGIDNENAYSRLNIDMTRNIYSSVPKTNQGDFVVDKVLPHAFSRDGDPNENHKQIAKYVRKYAIK